MVRRRRFIIAFVAGRCAACGDGCLKRWREPNLAKNRQHNRQGTPFGGGRKRGAEAQAVGRSRGGRTTKIHAIVDERGHPIAIEVMPGRLGDVRVATALISAVPPGASLAGEAAYDSDGLRRFLKERGRRNLIERMFCRLKDWRRIATRYEDSIRSTR